MVTLITFFMSFFALTPASYSTLGINPDNIIKVEKQDQSDSRKGGKEKVIGGGDIDAM